MAIKAGRVGVNPSNVDELGNVTVGGLTPEERAKLEKALVTPVTKPTEKEIVGVGTANEQIMFKVGDGLSIDGETSPFTLKASGGVGFEIVDVTFPNYITKLSSGFNKIVKIGNICIFNFALKSSSSIPGTGHKNLVNTGGIPESCRPNNIKYGTGVVADDDLNNGCLTQVDVLTGGSMGIDPSKISYTYTTETLYTCYGTIIWDIPTN